MDPKTFLSEQIRAGKDIVIGEDHASTTASFKLIEEILKQNPRQISAVAVELPDYLQILVDPVANGTMNKNIFIRQSCITYAHSTLEGAKELLSNDTITQEKYDEIEKNTFKEVDNATREKGSFSPEKITKVYSTFSKAYDLIETASSYNIPVIFNDTMSGLISAKFVAGIVNDSDLATRFDDRGAHKIITNQIDIKTAKPIIALRGSLHIWDANGTKNGLDDTLQRAGRNVVTIGHYGSMPKLKETFDNVKLINVTINDPSDFTIIGDKLFRQGDKDIYQGYREPPNNVSTPPFKLEVIGLGGN